MYLINRPNSTWPPQAGKHNFRSLGPTANNSLRTRQSVFVPHDVNQVEDRLNINNKNINTNKFKIKKGKLELNAWQYNKYKN